MKYFERWDSEKVKSNSLYIESMKMEVMSTQNAALQHLTPPPSDCPGDTSLIADISHKQKIGLWSTFCHLLIIILIGN